MKVTAADQMKMGEKRKPVPQDVKVFVHLANKGITGWNIILGKCECTELDVRLACNVLKVDPMRWLGTVQERRKVGW